MYFINYIGFNVMLTIYYNVERVNPPMYPLKQDNCGKNSRSLKEM